MSTQHPTKPNKSQAHYVCDLQPSVGTIKLAYRKEALNEADKLSRRPDFVTHATFPLFWNGEAPSEESNLRRKSKSFLDDAQLTLMIVDDLGQSLEFVDLIREGYSQESFYGGEGDELTRNIELMT
jgi:hypothetical protein